MKVFLSYNFNDEDFVKKVSYHLNTQKPLRPYLWATHGRATDFEEQIRKALSGSKAFLLFLGKELGETQEDEFVAAILNNRIKYRIVIRLDYVGPVAGPNALKRYPTKFSTVHVKRSDEDVALACAKEIANLLGIIWVEPDNYGPERYIFDYEKSIIDEYAKGGGKLKKELVEEGCPSKWPNVEKNEGTIPNPVPESEIGVYRDWDYSGNKHKDIDPRVTSAALSEYHSGYPMTFPEAGPRKFLYYPTRTDKGLTVGILVSGGIAPGINSVISGIVERQFLYAEKGDYERTLKVYGYQNGFIALIQEGSHYDLLKKGPVTERANDGGSMIGSSRVEELTDESCRKQALEKVVEHLRVDGVEILYIIGGHGSMRAAHAIWQKAHDSGSKLSVVAVPKSMDNDILWVWQSFGFMSAVEQAKELIGHMCTEVKSNPGLCVIQLFGSDSGFVASHAVLASGMCDLCLIPEVPFTMGKISSYIAGKLQQQYRAGGPTYSIVVMAEVAVPKDATQYFEDAGVALTPEEKHEIREYLKTGRLRGHTPDVLRQGTLKIVSRVLYKKVQEMRGEHWQRFRVITNEPKHQLRAGPPSCSDTIFGRRLGSLAVDCAMAGYTDFMISQWLTEYVMVPLRLVILGRKRIPEKGIFWKSVKASTGQPDDLA
jgi:6-phosphofructokinase 1